MKKIGVLLLVLIIVSQVAFADAVSDKIKRTENEIARLQLKLKTVNDPKHRQLIISTINNHKINLAKLRAAQAAQAAKPKKELVPKLALSGGAVLAGVDFSLPLKAFRIKLGAGYGSGNEYTVMTAQVGLERPFSPRNGVGLAATYGDYSERVEVPLAGEISKGAGWGGMIYYYQRVMRNLQAQIGYSTNLGALAALGFVLAF